MTVSDVAQTREDGEDGGVGREAGLKGVSECGRDIQVAGSQFEIKDGESRLDDGDDGIVGFDGVLTILYLKFRLGACERRCDIPR